MGLNLIMKREVFSIILNLAVQYEKKHGKRKGLTPLITNQLLAEALIARRLLDDDFLKAEYDSADPFKVGYPYRGFRGEGARQKRSEKQAKQKKAVDWSKQFRDAAEQWDTIPAKAKTYHVKRARKLLGRVSEAQLIVDLDRKDKEAIKKRRSQ